MAVVKEQIAVLKDDAASEKASSERKFKRAAELEQMCADLEADYFNSQVNPKSNIGARNQMMVDQFKKNKK